jgi:hypothetical protein
MEHFNKSDSLQNGKIQDLATAEEGFEILDKRGI